MGIGSVPRTGPGVPALLVLPTLAGGEVEDSLSFLFCSFHSQQESLVDRFARFATLVSWLRGFVIRGAGRSRRGWGAGGHRAKSKSKSNRRSFTAAGVRERERRPALRMTRLRWDGRISARLKVGGPGPGDLSRPQ